MASQLEENRHAIHHGLVGRAIHNTRVPTFCIPITLRCSDWNRNQQYHQAIHFQFGCIETVAIALEGTMFSIVIRKYYRRAHVRRLALALAFIYMDKIKIRLKRFAVVHNSKWFTVYLPNRRRGSTQTQTVHMRWIHDLLRFLLWFGSSSSCSHEKLASISTELFEFVLI